MLYVGFPHMERRNPCDDHQSQPGFYPLSEPVETLRGRGYENQIYSMPVFKTHGLYLGLASLIHEGDRNEKNFDCVDCELTWSADGKKFDFAAMDQAVIPRGDGHYPDGEFDNSCIYASSPVTDGQKYGFTTWVEMDSIQISGNLRWEEHTGKQINLPAGQRKTREWRAF